MIQLVILGLAVVGAFVLARPLLRKVGVNV
jgi:hypothetical protein